MQVYPHMTIADLFDACGHALKWPQKFMTLMIGEDGMTIFGYHSEQPYRDEWFLLNFFSASLEEIKITIFLHMPTNIRGGEAKGFCLCYFGGCCKRCYVPSNEICWGCGNNGCCRSKNCGCECCMAEGGRNIQIASMRVCPILGCRPWWCHAHV